MRIFEPKLICKCSVFYFENKKYYTRCDGCKNKPVDVSNDNLNSNSNPNQFSWYEYPIIKIRDDPKFRLGLNLFCIWGGIFWFGIGYIDFFKLIDISMYPIGGKIITCFLIVYVCVGIGYILVIEQLDKNKKRYQL